MARGDHIHVREKVVSLTIHSQLIQDGFYDLLIYSLNTHLSIKKTLTGFLDVKFELFYHILTYLEKKEKIAS